MFIISFSVRIAYNLRVVKRLQGLRWVRQHRGLSQMELAERSGLTQARISLLERGETLAQRWTVQRLADALECLQRDLVDGPELPLRTG